MKMKIEINGSKITVFNVAKLTFTILLGYKIGKYCTMTPEYMFYGGMNAIETMILKKLGIDRDSTYGDVKKAAEDSAEKTISKLKNTVDKLEKKINGKIASMHLNTDETKEGETES